jgi:Protein of unknown function (DUF3017)
MTADPAPSRGPEPDGSDPSSAVDPAGSALPPTASSGDRARATASPDPFVEDRAEEDAALIVDAVRDRVGPRLQWPLGVVLAGLVVSLVIVSGDHFRRGSVLYAAFVALAFVLRLGLSDGGAGWLAVRSRRVDLVVLGGLAGSLAVFSAIVPPPS